MQSDSTTEGRRLTPPEDRSGAFEMFYREHLDGMVRLATFLVYSQPNAEEIVQESFLIVHRRWDELHTPAGFLRTTVVNKCRDAMRRKSVKVKKMTILRPTIEAQQTDDLAETHADSDYFLGLLQLG